MTVKLRRVVFLFLIKIKLANRENNIKVGAIDSVNMVDWKLMMPKSDIVKIVKADAKSWLEMNSLIIQSRNMDPMAPMMVLQKTEQESLFGPAKRER